MIVILGVDFLKLFKMQNIFDPIFFNSFAENDANFNCYRIEHVATIPSRLMPLFKKSRYLDESERESFVNFLNEFHDVFTNEIFTENCKIGEHVINMKDPFLMKAPRRIPIQIRGEGVNKIISEMKDQGVIEESNSSWTLPVMLS